MDLQWIVPVCLSGVLVWFYDAISAAMELQAMDPYPHMSIFVGLLYL